MTRKLIATNSEINDLTIIMKEVESRGKQGPYATKWYAEIRGIIESRLSVLNGRLESIQ